MVEQPVVGGIYMVIVAPLRCPIAAGTIIQCVAISMYIRSRAIDDINYDRPALFSREELEPLWPHDE